LRTSVADVLCALPAVRKPADLRKCLHLDWTLSWQLFQVADLGNEPVPLLAAGPVVPSRISLKKFLDRAAARGAAAAGIEKLWRDYGAFEHLIETHAGNRTTFNSMITAASGGGGEGVNDEWLAADVQHRRNAFRAMSHVLGMQAVTKHLCGIFHPRDDGAAWDFATVVGFVGLRLLRELPRVLVFRTRNTDPITRQRTRRVPLGDGPAGGYLLSPFSTTPLPSLSFRELDAGWVVNELEAPDIGNMGACTLCFGAAYYDHPVPAFNGVDNTFDSDVAVDKPVEVLLNDMLFKPDMLRGEAPEAEVFLGNTHSDTANLPGERVPLLGRHRIERLGIGPDALATRDVPDYPQIMRAAAAAAGWKIEAYEAWRFRVELPVYQSTVRMKWRLPG
jgi:hypothetical protein